MPDNPTPEPDPPETNEEQLRRILRDNARKSGAIIQKDDPPEQELTRK